MAHAPLSGNSAVGSEPRDAGLKWGPNDFRFESLVVSEPPFGVRWRPATLATSIGLHAVVISTVIVVPILLHDSIPEPGNAVRTLFAIPAPATPLPPAPPAAAPVRASRVALTPSHPVDSSAPMAPTNIPGQTGPEEPGLYLGTDGEPGGARDGIPGGDLDGVIRVPPPAPPPPPAVIRIGGALVAPKLLHKVPPVYPEAAGLARLRGVVILEARVDVNGLVKDVKVLRGIPLLGDAALAAVRQWRYQPLLLNGAPTEFILTVTVNFTQG